MWCCICAHTVFPISGLDVVMFWCPQWLHTKALLSDWGAAGCLPWFPRPHQKLIGGWRRGACSNSSSTWTGLCPTAARLVQTSPPEEASSFHPLHLVVCSFSIIGNKILPGAICSTPVLLTACLPHVSEIVSRWCFHNPARGLTLEEQGSFSEPCLVLWGQGCCHMMIWVFWGLRASTVLWATLFLPPGQTILVLEMFLKPLKCWHVVVLCITVSLSTWIIGFWQGLACETVLGDLARGADGFKHS